MMGPPPRSFWQAGFKKPLGRRRENGWKNIHLGNFFVVGDGWQHWQVQGATYFIPRQVKSFMNPTRAKGSTGTLTAKEVPPE